MSNEDGWPDASNPGMPLNPERDGWHWLDAGSPVLCEWRAARGWMDETWWPHAADLEYLGPCLTPSEHHQRTLAASAAAWLAAREAAEAAVQHVFNAAEYTDARNKLATAMLDLRALPPPSDAMAALAEVVRVAVEKEREACAADTDCGCDVKPIVLAKLASHGEREAWRCCGQHYDACLAVQAAAIRARSEGEGA